MDQLVAQRSHQLSTADGTDLFVTDYLLPAAQARGSVLLMHGLGEHSGATRWCMAESARLMRSILSAIDYCHSHAHELRTPTLLLVAGADRLVDAEGSRRFIAQLAPRLAQMEVYEGFYHEIFKEPDAARPFADLRNWLARQTGMA